MKQKRIAECKYNSLAPYSGKEANGKIEYGKNLMKHRKIYLAVSIGCLFMAAIYYQIESHFLINRNPFFYCALPALIIGLCAGHRLFLSSIECNIQSSVKDCVLTPIETFSMGKTIVATDVPGTVEIVQDDINGIIVPINSDKAIAEGIVRLFKDKALKEKYEKNAKKTYNEKFSYPAFCKNYLTVYNSL